MAFFRRGGFVNAKKVQMQGPLMLRRYRVAELPSARTYDGGVIIVSNGGPGSTSVIGIANNGGWYRADGVQIYGSGSGSGS